MGRTNNRNNGKGLAPTKTLVANASSSMAKPKPRGKASKKAKPTNSDYLKALRASIMIPTRYPDLPLLTGLGILEDVEAIFLNLGMAKFLRMESPSFKEPTIQLLASLAVRYGVESHTTPENVGRIEFRVGGKNYSVSFHEMCGIYGFNERIGTNLRDPKEAHYLWRLLGGGDYKAGGTKVAGLRNPAIRYAHKILAHTLFARRETSNIKEDEICLLIEGLKPFLSKINGGTEIKGNPDVNLGAILALQLKAYKDWALKKYVNKKLAVISIGGIVTPLLKYCEITLGNAVEGSSRIDALYLQQTGFLAGRVLKAYAYCFHNGDNHDAKVILPNPRSHLSSLMPTSNLGLGKSFSSIPPQNSYYLPSTFQR